MITAGKARTALSVEPQKDVRLKYWARLKVAKLDLKTGHLHLYKRLSTLVKRAIYTCKKVL